MTTAIDKVEDAKRRIALSTKKHVYYASDNVTPVGEVTEIEPNPNGVHNRAHLEELRETIRKAEGTANPNIRELAIAAYDAFNRSLGSNRVQTSFGKVEVAAPYHKLSSKIQGHWDDVARAVLAKLGL
jgi:hypothetical protein